MKLIVGLGNPGLRYRNHRHNVGRQIVENFAHAYTVKLKAESGSLSRHGQASIEGNDFVLAYPLTFMNCSGESIKFLLKKYKVIPSGLLVICDDLNLIPGKMRLRAKGSSGGHQGLASVTRAIHRTDFARLRIGIGRPLRKAAVKDFVLSPFNKSEQALMQQIRSEAVECCRLWLTKGVTAAMNKFN
jgi:PTH1 family peptidyl-tRNA hydrolase